MLIPSSFILTSLAVAQYLASANAAAASPATVYSVVTSDPLESFEVHGSTTYKAVSTMDGGAVTRYEQVVAESLIIGHPLAGNTNPPDTVLTEPITFTSTFDQGSATIRFHQPAETESLAPDFNYINEDRTRNCSLDVAKLEGSCVEVVELVGVNGTTTLTTSFTGSLMPIATLGAESSGAISCKLYNGVALATGLLAAVTFGFGL